MVMAIASTLVKTDMLQEDGENRQTSFAGLRMYKPFDQNTNPGGLGDPRPATAEMGQKLFQIAEEFLVDAIEKIQKNV